MTPLGERERNVAKAEVLRDSIALLSKVERDIKSKDGKNALNIAIGLLRVKREMYEEKET